MTPGYRPISTWLLLSSVLVAAVAGCSDDEAGPREPSDNLPPTIDAILVAPETIHPDSLVTLTVEASDPNGDPLTYRWSVNGGGFVGDSTGATVTWRAPDEAHAYISQITVSDGWRTVEASEIIWMTALANQPPSTRITRMFVTDRDGYHEITDFATSIPTLRDTSLVTLFFDGTDTDGFVTGYRYRIARVDIIRQSIRTYPYGDFFAADSVTAPIPPHAYYPTRSFTSNDYFLIAQSRDDDDAVDATPDTVFFRVNHAPSFDTGQVFPGPGEMIAWGPQDSLDVRFRAEDVETPSTGLVYRVVLDGIWGPTVGPVTDEADLEQRWPMPDPGTHEIMYVAEDPGRREVRLLITFQVVI